MQPLRQRAIAACGIGRMPAVLAGHPCSWPFVCCSAFDELTRKIFPFESMRDNFTERDRVDKTRTSSTLVPMPLLDIHEERLPWLVLDNMDLPQTWSLRLIYPCRSPDWNTSPRGLGGRKPNSISSPPITATAKSDPVHSRTNVLYAILAWEDAPRRGGHGHAVTPRILLQLYPTLLRYNNVGRSWVVAARIVAVIEPP